MSKIGVLVVENNNIIRNAVLLGLRRYDQFHILAALALPSDVKKLLSQGKPDVVICGIDFEEEEVQELVNLFPGTSFLFTSNKPSFSELSLSLRLGGVGLIGKGCEFNKLAASVWAIYHGLGVFDSNLKRDVAYPEDSKLYLSKLTERELQVLTFLARGCEVSEIAETLFLSPRTVRNHLAKAASKLGLPGRNALIRFAVLNGIEHLASREQGA
ncbi:MAG: response regulator transcription factor [Bacillota bacterium]